MTDNKWQFLKPGDIVDIIAPAHGYSYELKDKVEEIILGFGYKPNFLSTINDNDPFCSDNDDNRLQQLGEALYSDESKAIISIQGGYGCSRLLPYLKDLTAPPIVKPLIGFSDVTALHIFLQKIWNWPSLHGSVRKKMLDNQIETIKPYEEINKLLTGQRVFSIFEDLEPLNNAGSNNQVIESKIVGGNLSLVQVSIGTFWQINTKDKILFLEDVDERGYRIDRMLEHLRQASVFDQVKAIIFGDFTGGKEKNGTSLCSEALIRLAEKVNVPVIRCYGIGHDMVNQPLPLGTNCKLEINSGKIRLSVSSGGKP